MQVRPIDFQGMMQNTTEVANTRTNEQNRPNIQQDFVAIQNQQEASVSTTQVQEFDNATGDKYDASEGGDGSGYEGNKNQKKEKEKKKAVSDGSVRVKAKRSSFEISV